MALSVSSGRSKQSLHVEPWRAVRLSRSRQPSYVLPVPACAHMALQVRDLQLQVEALQAELAGKDGEVAALTEATLALQSQDLQAAKIIDLSKKVGGE